MAMNSKAIEETAVDAVKAKIRLSPVLSTYISDNDRTPSFDGHICVHENEQQTKKNVKQVNVQIKGCEKKKFNKDNITYPIDIDDLKNYKANGGCLFFVVYVRQKEDGFETKVYYQELTPVKIFDILASTKAKSKPSVLLKALPQKPEEIATIVRNCYEQCLMQASYAKCDIPRLEDLEEKGIVESIHIPVFGYGIKPQYPAAFSNYDVYIYVKLKGSDVWLPTQGQPLHMIDKQRISRPVTVAGNVFYDYYDVVHESTATTIIIGNSFRIKFVDGTPGCNMEYKASSMLRVLCKDCSFIVAAIKDNGFETNGVRHEFDKNSFDLSRFNIDTQEANIRLMERYIQMLDMQGCSDDLDLSNLTAEDYKNLNLLTATTLDHVTVSGIPDNLPPILSLSVGNLRFALWHKEISQGVYSIYNAMDYLKPIYTGIRDKDNLPVPVSIIFDEDAYLTVSNIQFERILPSFQKYKATPYIYDIANTVMLFMIGASDKASGTRKKQLIDTAMDFAVWLESMPLEVWDPRISILNRLQIIKRTRALTEAENEELYQILTVSADCYSIMAGTNILLERFKEIDCWLNKMTAKEQEDFMKFPIVHLWKGKKPDVGSSTRSEIEYANAAGEPVRYLEE